MTYPPVWGPLYHDTLMFFATHFPEYPSVEEQKEATEYLKLFFKFVPCPSCSVHSRMYFHNNPPDTSSGASLVSWVVAMHNDINKQTGKKHNWTVVEALQAFKYRYFNNQLLLSHCDRQNCEVNRTQNEVYNKEEKEKHDQKQPHFHKVKTVSRKAETEEEPNTSVVVAVVSLLLFIVFCVLLVIRDHRRPVKATRN